MKNTKFNIWLIKQKWLWKKVVFDNGIVGKNYVRYDHLLLPIAVGMGDAGKLGNLDKAIEISVAGLLRKETNK